MEKFDVATVKEISEKAHALGKIEALELIAEMVEGGVITSMDDIKTMARTIRKSCNVMREELDLSSEKLDVLKRITPDELDELKDLINDIQKI